MPKGETLEIQKNLNSYDLGLILAWHFPPGKAVHNEHHLDGVVFPRTCGETTHSCTFCFSSSSPVTWGWSLIGKKTRKRKRNR